MHFTSLLTTLAAITPLALAGPPYSNVTANTKDAPDGEYYLVTSVTDGDRSKDGLYVVNYHIAASQNEVTLQGIDKAVRGFLNDTYQQFVSPTTEPWGLVAGGGFDYRAWSTVELDFTTFTAGFYFDGAKLLWQAAPGQGSDPFGGWLACDWWHGLPQLFWIDTEYKEYAGIETYPSTCAAVDLLAVPV